MTFVEGRDDGDLSLQPRHHQQNDEEMLTMLRGTTSPAPQQQQRGLSIPYSPGGKRGSLTTGALSPPMPFGGARRQSSLRSDHLRF